MAGESYKENHCKHCDCVVVLNKNWGAISGGKFICDDKECLDKEQQEISANGKET